MSSELPHTELLVFLFTLFVSVGEIVLTRHTAFGFIVQFISRNLINCHLGLMRIE